MHDQVVIATKFGVYHNPDKTLSVDSRPETIRLAIDGSLSRLGIDCIDLYYQHRTDPNVEPEEVAGVMAELMQTGKIRAWGISEADEDYLRRANAVCPVAAVQNRYSMLARWHEPLFPVLEELNVALVAFSPMANGFLTGAYSPKTKFEGAQDYRDGMPQYTPEGYEKDRAVLGSSAILRAKGTRRWLRSRSRGCSARNRGLSPFRAAASPSACGRTLEPPRYRLRLRRSRASTLRLTAWTLPFSVATHGHRVRRVCRRGIGFVGLMHGACDIILTWSRLQGLRCPRQLAVE